jgi:hypothetical protein
MNKSVAFTAVMALGLLAAVSPASADVVDFTTAGTFSVSGTNTMTGTTKNGKTASVTFNPVTITSSQYPQQDVPSAPGGPAAEATVDTLGSFTVSLPAGTSIGANTPAGVDGTFLLTLNQAIEGGASGTADYGTSALTGRLSKTGGPTGSLVITFAQTSVTIDGVTYTVEDLGQNGLASDQLAIGASGAAIEAAITSPAPEPSFLALTGVGFLGLLFVAVRRYKQSTVTNLQ